jgi:hypothetical protein
MAQVNSMVCFGGLNGKTVTFTDAGDVVNLTNHGVRPGLACFFQNSGGALPTGLTANQLYYAKQGADQNKFLLYPTQADAIAGTNQVTFNGTGSGTTKVKSSLVFTGADLSRYDNTRIYDGLVSWNNGRSGASPYDIEVAEIGESFSDIMTAVFEVTVPSARNVITTEIGADFEAGTKGIRSAAFHSGNFPALTLDTLTLNSGYVLYNSAVTTGSLFKITRYRDTLDGAIVMNKANASVTVTDLGVQCRLYNCQVIGAASSVVGMGLNLRSALGEAVNNLFYGFATGASFGSSQLGLYFVNNTLTKNNAALSASSTVRGFFYNNISRGNTTDWPTQPTNLEGASNNAGAAGAAWVTGSGTRVTIETTDFANFAGNDFKAASSSSPQVEGGIAPYGAPLDDIAGHVRPDYITGSGTTPVTAGSFVTGVVYSITTVGTTDFTAIGASANTVGVEFRATGAGSGTGTATPQAKYDIGCFEFDHGYGPWPSTHTLTLTNVVVGSRVFIRDQANTTTHYDQIAAGPTVEITVTVYGDSRDNWRIKIRKASAAPYYQAYETLMTAAAGSSSIYVNQLPN